MSFFLFSFLPPEMVSSNPNIPRLTYGTLQRFEDFQIPDELNEDLENDFDNIHHGTAFRNWIQNDPKERGRTLFGSVLDSLDPVPFEAQWIGLRFLVMAHFFMCHPTIERLNRGEHYFI